MVGVIAWRWTVSADCAAVVSAEETGREEADKMIQEEVGIYIYIYTTSSQFMDMIDRDQ